MEPHVTTDPIQRLLDEHATLQSRFEPLRRVVAVLETGGQAVVPAVLPALREASQVLNTDLIAHAKREDEAFFPALELAMGLGFGPTRVMRMEHVDIEEGATLVRDTLRELHEVDHPAIVEGGEALRSLAEPGADAAHLRELCASLLQRIDEHFMKEEQILFPMSRQILDSGVLAEVARRMDAMDGR